MADELQVIDRPYRIYAALRRTVAPDGFPEAVDAAFPAQEPDPAKWVTELEQLVADGSRPVATTSIDGYGVPAREWADAHRRLADSVAILNTVFLSTSSPDGRPHAVPVGALWVQGTWWFTSGPGTRKSRDLTADPRCVLSVGLPGMDVVVEGRATGVTDEATLVRMAAVYSSQGWPATAVTGDRAGFTAEYSAPSAGPPPWYLYRVDPEVVFGLGTAEPYGATRWTF